ncbi:adenylyl-sulfate kinase [Kineosporia rhizophila]|uniref:adenylyl-sulfate kinase n=1 Tax=Kineosporia TaxID=49184 RepID=UPI001E377696|nr:adenylyl-sulfate kinase [Kineosporia sp. NBRC 101677]MCE0535067.1 adenylyl-sulfate kinase [Kineosporia rhizophila]GLY14649.1 hypothetical protein Kisp01_16640 [Kineosporia sp. NBRC 101677]
MPDPTAAPTTVSTYSWHPPQQLLELAELVLSGGLTAAPGIVEVPAEIDKRLDAGETITLEDAEGTPVAGLSRVLAGEHENTETLPLPQFTPLQPFTHGPVRSARRTPAQVRAELDELGPGEVLAVPVTTELTATQVEQVRAQAQRAGQQLLWIAVLGAGRQLPLPPDGLWRAVRDVATEAGAGAALVAVPLLAHTDDAALLTAVARSFGAGEVLTTLPGAEGELHPAFAREHARAVPPPHRRGVTLFFTGLSGSGKSTVAKALTERLLDRTTRTVSLLDGDEVRRMLSAGLTFSRADRDLNIRRIGFVAAEITRHGGLAVCAPIAPFESVRAEVRAGVEQVGDFVLVHVSTPLEECERRDRKGLYAKARRGEIPDFTGISSPYDVPADPELRIDTTGISIDEAVEKVWALLTERGYLDGPGKD